MRYLLLAVAALLIAPIADAGFLHRRGVCLDCQPVVGIPVVQQQIIWQPQIIQVPGVMVPKVYPTPLRNLLFGTEQFVPNCNGCAPVPAPQAPSVLQPVE